MKRWAALTLPLLAAAQAYAQEAPPAAAVNAPPVDALAEAEVLLFEVTLDRGTLSDSLQAYSLDGNVLLPMGELGRLLDLALEVRPRERQIIGRVLQRPLLLDIASRTARVDTRSLEIGPGDAVAGLTDIYLSAKLIERLLPLRVAVDNEGLIIALTATEQLPIQAKLERLNRLRGLRPDVETSEDVLWVESTPGMLSVPAFDVALDTSLESAEPQFRRRYDVRVGADVLYTGFQGYVGSDERGRPSTSRFVFERRDREGDLLGPVGATQFAVGDVYTPSLAVGARSVGGRGVTLSTAPLEQTSVFDRVDLRGELPIGFDVELYINDILRSGQQTPVQGRYEFLDVPLVRGVNVIRIVSYGPRGERFEETRVINVAGGALPQGKFTVDVGVVQQDKPLIDLRRGGRLVGGGEGELRASLGVAYGLTAGTTLLAGAAQFTPREGPERRLGTVGIRTSLAGFAMQIDGAYDDDGGKAIALGAAGTLLGVSSVVRHAEYRGGFVDEALPTGGDSMGLRRHSEATMDFSVGPVVGLTFPVSLRAQRDEFADGRVATIGGLRFSSSTSNVLFSAGFDVDVTQIPDARNLERLVGNFAASTFAGGVWQLRGTVDYEILPSFDIRAVALTVDRDLSDRASLRFGIGHAFGADDDNTTLQAASVFRLPFADLSLASEYTTPTDDWRVALQMAFGLVFDPFRRQYDMTRPGAGVGGNAALQAFIDRDANDRYDPQIDEPVANVRISAGRNDVTTDEEGRALLPALGYAVTTRLRLDLDGIDNPYVSSPPQTVEFMPRPGSVARIYYPLRPVGEVLARVQFRDAGGRLTGLSAVKVRAVRDGAEPVEASTEFDGTVVFDRLPAGRYRLELDPEQSARLAMKLTAPITFEIASDGGFVPDVIATVIFDR